MASLRFVLTLHNHQPVGNFEGVFESAYQDSYAPFLEVLEAYPELPISLHTSGCLMEWLAARHPEYIDRVRRLHDRGQIEILGGGFYEPILPMIPLADRVGQIRQYSAYLHNLFGCEVRGMWVPERVWEQSLAASIVDAGIQYTVLDDFHFKCAGLAEDELPSYFITEDDGRLLRVFPGNEKMRYLIPFRDPEEVLNEFRRIATLHPGAVVVFADDGEKFGSWPETKQHVYTHGWLRRFFDMLMANRHWIEYATLGQAVARMLPAGKVYLPDVSYREMTEWALPVRQLADYQRLWHGLDQDPRGGTISRFVRGGLWRNFKVKYPESDEMYTRMLQVSRKLARAAASDAAPEKLATARRELHRGQCNCSYWHGSFGGLYLPHLRNAIFAHLIAADNLLEEAAGRNDAWIEASADDWNKDAYQEICIASDKLLAYLAPHDGGHLYELDLRAITHNLLATMMRRPEGYHEKIVQAAGGGQNGDGPQSIHDRVVFKQAGLEERLYYDAHPRKSLIDHFWAADVEAGAVAACAAPELGDFVRGVYDARIRRGEGRVQVAMTREGLVSGQPVRITKTLTVEAGSSALEVFYLLENLPRDRELHFAVEWNFAGLAGNAPDRYFSTSESENAGPLESRLDLHQVDWIGLVDRWLGLDISLEMSREGGLWTFPVQTVSQSEGGFELVFQSAVVLPHWRIHPDAEGRWEVGMTLTLDTSAAEARQQVMPLLAIAQ